MEDLMAIQIFKAQIGENTAQRVARWMLSGMMMFAGIPHLTFARRAFRAQVPEFVPEMLPLTVDQVVVWSGLVEVAMGASLLLLSGKERSSEPCLERSSLRSFQAMECNGSTIATLSV